MIAFDYETYRAEINAMPCLPDEFEIHISRQTALMMGNNPRFRAPQFSDYDQTEWQGIHSYVLRYKRFEHPQKPPISVQDLILRRQRNQP